MKAVIKKGYCDRCECKKKKVLVVTHGISTDVILAPKIVKQICFDCLINYKVEVTIGGYIFNLECGWK